MTPREIITCVLWMQDQPLPASDEADRIVDALRAAGYSIIHDSENHGPTVERAAGIAKQSKDGRDWIPGSLLDTLVREGTARVRAMTTGGRE